MILIDYFAKTVNTLLS